MFANAMTQAAQIVGPIADEICEEAKNNKQLVKAGKNTELAIALAFALQNLFWAAEA